VESKQRLFYWSHHNRVGPRPVLGIELEVADKKNVSE
jgi:hypothetical protein